MRVLIWAVSILLLLGVGAFTLFDWALRRKYEPTLGMMRKDVTDMADFFCEQQTILARDPWFHEPRAEGDAGPLLNKWVEWDPSPPLPQDSPLAIPAHLPQADADFDNWLTSDVDVSTLDFSWMNQLHAYDRWDTLRDSPIAQAKPVDWLSAPTPNFFLPRLWGKFRLLHGLRTGRPAEAARDVRQLAWLAYRSDRLMGGAIASALLKSEREAYDSLQTPPAEWEPMSTEQTRRMFAVIASSLAFSQLGAPMEVARQARGCGQPAVSRCIALADAAIMAKYLQPLARDRYPEFYEELATELAERPCPTSLVQTIWERGMTIEEGHAHGSGSHPGWFKTLSGAYGGSHILGGLLSASSTDLQPLKKFRADLESGHFQASKP